MTSPPRTAALGLACLAALAIPTHAAPPGPASSAVTAAGVTLRSTGATLPTGDRTYPEGPHVEVMNDNCLACHSAGMVLTQPRLGRADWQAEVNKMIAVYKAPVEPADAALIVDYLAQLKPGP